MSSKRQREQCYSGQMTPSSPAPCNHQTNPHRQKQTSSCSSPTNPLKRTTSFLLLIAVVLILNQLLLCCSAKPMLMRRRLMIKRNSPLATHGESEKHISHHHNHNHHQKQKKSSNNDDDIVIEDALGGNSPKFVYTMVDWEAPASASAQTDSAGDSAAYEDEPQHRFPVRFPTQWNDELTEMAAGGAYSTLNQENLPIKDGLREKVTDLANELHQICAERKQQQRSGALKKKSSSSDEDFYYEMLCGPQL